MQFTTEKVGNRVNGKPIQGKCIGNTDPPLKERAENGSPINRAIAVPKVLERCLFQPPSRGFPSERTALAVGELAGTISHAIALEADLTCAFRCAILLPIAPALCRAFGEQSTLRLRLMKTIHRQLKTKYLEWSFRELFLAPRLLCRGRTFHREGCLHAVVCPHVVAEYNFKC
jgi:hypothetical protein